jgi:antitoxin HicB
MARKRLATYLSARYPFRVRVDSDAGYVVDFPDLPGCFTGAETLAELPAMIEEAKGLWIESEYEVGADIPVPTLMDLDVYSGKFNVRLARSLHEALSEASEAAGVSLNQYVATLLARGDAQARVERRIDDLVDALRSEGIALSGHARVADTRGEYRAGGAGVEKPKRRRKPA